MAKTLGFTKNLKLPLLSRALRCIQESPTLSRKALGNCMGVNQPVSAMFLYWLRHTGLVFRREGSRSNELTAVGALIAEHDPMLSDLGTQWLLHYYLATDQQERSDAWYVFFNKFLLPGMSFTSEAYRAHFADVMGNGVSNLRALKSDPTAVLFTYTNPVSLADLGLLSKQKKVYRAENAHYPHRLVIGFMLLDWWKRHYDYTNTLRFSQLCEEAESLGRLCVATPAQVRRFVAELTGQGYLTFSETQHEPVNRLYEGEPYGLLERYYADGI